METFTHYRHGTSPLKRISLRSQRLTKDIFLRELNGNYRDLTWMDFVENSLYALLTILFGLFLVVHVLK